MRLVLFCCLLLALALPVFAQPETPPDTLWTTTIGTANDETGWGTCIATDGGFVIAGRGSEKGQPAGQAIGLALQSTS